MGMTLTEAHGQPVPVRPDVERWATRPVRRRVLAVVHTVTSGQRLLDVVRLLEGDWRVQVFFTSAPDVFSGGVADFLEGLGALVLPWGQAVQTVFDLAVAAGYGGLHELHAPVVVLPHGAGHNKFVPARGGEAVAARGIYGFSRQRLVRDGSVVPAAIVLAHRDERERLGAECPEALPVAEVVGDPCFDRVAASRPARALYRQALRTRAGQQLVLLCSTWGPGSLLGRCGRELIDRVVAELPPPEYRVAVLLHPHVWHTHSEWQVRSWFADLGRGGLAVVSHRADWVGALVAADFVVGDHGSVSLYGAMTGRPVLLASWPEADVDPRSPLAELASFVPRLHGAKPVRRQLARAAATYRADLHEQVAARISSEPGRFTRKMRALLYRGLRLRAPGAVPVTGPAGLPRVVEYEQPGSVAS
ncbi:hypothetical protein GPA10_16685 [Streptomyces sp. p1417]|uniref:CDP-Glycerol:Poly(Glycerophosphate) glycerophosphotransferase n=1 Tax=Streptomyces typhae TaxID=2681492 RepID=A0A6L6WXX0_9ACTN|nr:hypothetical protein [Streptomyces typhae]MVO86350.1 hypothetical protein [Streptomyces typhae]